MDETEHLKKLILVKSIVSKLRTEKILTEEERLLIQSALVDHMIDDFDK